MKTQVTATTLPNQSRKGKWKNIFLKNYELYLFLLPAEIILFCFNYMPMYGVQMAFRDFKPALGITGSEWVGFENFRRFFSSHQFGTIMKNTLILSFYEILVSFPIPIIMALVLNQLRFNRFKKVYQVVTYLPHFISTVVLIGMIRIMLSPSVGLMGAAADLFHTEAPNLLGEEGAFRSIYVWSGVWQNAGWDSIIYIAALAGIDPNLYEAASVDGATKWQKIISIDIPSILPTCIIMFILRIGSVMNLGFEKVYLLQNSLNLSVSEVIATYTYRMGIVKMQYSLSAAIGLFNTLINVILLIMANKISQKLSNESLW